MIATKGYGITPEMIDWSSPSDMEQYIKAHEEEMIERDYMNWISGRYLVSALDCTVCNSELWRKKGSKPHKYFERPILSAGIEREKEEIEYKESNEEVAVFEMKQRIELLRMQGLPESPE